MIRGLALQFTNLVKFTVASLMIITSVEANCNLIRDMDIRNLCEVLSTSQCSRCYLIKDKDYKFFRIPLITGEKSRCNLLKDSDNKNLRKRILSQRTVLR
jgi:hypothetical protein